MRPVALSITFVWAAVIVAVFSIAHCTAADSPTMRRTVGKLSKRDAALLERLTSTLVFDPRGAEFGKFTGVDPATKQLWTKIGWRVRAADKKSHIYHAALTIGEAIEPDTKFEPLDFVGIARDVYANVSSATEVRPAGTEDAVRFRQRAKLCPCPTKLADNTETFALLHAAWLHRLGADDTALRVSYFAQRLIYDAEYQLPEMDVLDSLKQAIADEHLSDAANCFARHDDARALATTTECLRAFADEQSNYPANLLLHHELLRRQAAGRLGRRPAANAPREFAEWDNRRKIEFLIGELDEVDAAAVHRHKEGLLDVTADWRAREVIRLGETAVPALIDVVENDQRFCRLQEGARFRQCPISMVRDVAISILRSILRVENFDPRWGAVSDRSVYYEPTEIDHLSQDDAAQMLRAYWDEYGQMRLAERMISVLRDRTSSIEARCEAARVLAQLDVDPLSDRIEATWRPIMSRTALHRDLQEFSDPTVAEMMLAAFDRDLAAFDRDVFKHRWQPLTTHSDRVVIEDSYLSSLSEIGDRRVLPELKRRFASEKRPRLARKLAFACYWLGDAGPIETIAERAANGTFPTPSTDNLDYYFLDGATYSTRYPLRAGEIAGVVSMLATARTAHCDHALLKIAEPGHPWAASLRMVVTTPLNAPARLEHSWLNSSQLLAYPFAQNVWQSALQDTTPTGGQWSIESDAYAYHGKGCTSESGTLKSMALGGDSDRFRKHADERVCDRAALELSKLIWSWPRFHPLLRDHDNRLTQSCNLLDLYKGRLRPMTLAERAAIGISTIDADVDIRYVIDVPPLDQPATADDVKHGRALFELRGQGKLFGERLPAKARWRDAEKQKASPAVLVVQAEAAPDGKRRYGILTSQGPFIVAGEELDAVTPLGQP